MNNNFLFIVKFVYIINNDKQIFKLLYINKKFMYKVFNYIKKSKNSKHINQQFNSIKVDRQFVIIYKHE